MSAKDHTTTVLDTDGDGTPDHLDDDDDNDGVPDHLDKDDDGDGIPDDQEAAVAAGIKAGTMLDTDGDGIPDQYDADDDNDGVPDHLDKDDDGDGIPDDQEADQKLVAANTGKPELHQQKGASPKAGYVPQYGLSLPYAAESYNRTICP